MTNDSSPIVSLSDAEVEPVAQAMFHAECEPHKAVTGYGDTFRWDDAMPEVRKRLMNSARAAITAWNTRASRPAEGEVEPVGDWVMVPREPTEAMLEAWTQASWQKLVDGYSPTPTEHPEDGGGSLGYGYRAMLSAAPTRPISPAHGVKELEWKDREDRDEDGGVDVVGSYADALFHRQYWTSWDGRDEDPWRLYCGSRVLGQFPSEEQAKAAAQADFAQRVLSSLQAEAEVVAPRSQAELEALPAHPYAKWVGGLPLGLHRVFWKSGGSSLAAIGMQADGRRWLAPCNWMSPTLDPESGSWGEMERTDLLFAYPEKPEAEVAGDEPVAWWCEHGDGNIEVVMWPEARDSYAAKGYEITPLGPLTRAALKNGRS